MFRLRNQTELNALFEELSAVYDQNVLLKMHIEATDEAHSFLYINLMYHEKMNMMYQSFIHVLRALEHDVAPHKTHTHLL